MTRPFPSFGNDMRSVLLGTLAVIVVAAWATIMFGFPEGLVPVDPSRAWLLLAAALCAFPAVLAARFKWAIVPGTPAAAGFAAICALSIVSRYREPEYPYVLEAYTTGMAVFVALCGLAPLCILIGIAYSRLGMRKMWAAVIALAIWSAPVLAVVSVNVADYVTFRAALRRVQGLGEPQIIAMAQRARQAKEPLRFRGGDLPAEFAPLRPKQVHIAPGYSYTPLYRRGDMYLEFAIETKDEQQTAYFFTNCDGPQKEVILWRNPPSIPKSGPEPIVRLRQYSMHWFREWIVLPDRILVFGTKDDDPRGRAAVLAEAALETSERDEIAKVVTETKARIGGRAFMAPVFDGWAVLLSFGGSDGPEPDDILLHNAWTEEVRPLFAAVGERMPPEFQSDFERRIEANRQDGDEVIVDVRPISEIRDERPRLPVWCVWPALLRPEAGYVAGRVGTTHVPDPLRYIYRDE